VGNNSSDVYVNGIPLARVGSLYAQHKCGKSKHGPSPLAAGSGTVFNNNIAIGRQGDPVACGSGIVTGSGNVFCADKSTSVDVAPYVPPDDQQMSYTNARRLVDRTNSNAVIDEPEYEGELVTLYAQGYPEVTEAPPVAQPDHIDTEVAEPNETVIPVACTEIVMPVDYSYQLSPNITLAALSNRAIFPHTVKAQAGYSLSDIVCNLEALSINIIEPIIAQFPLNRFNSGFRTATRGTSQHEHGMAVDLQWAGVNPAYYNDVCRWILDNLNFDTLGLEMGRSPWIHITFKRGQSQRRRIFTYSPSQSPNYKFGVLINYQANTQIV